MVAEARRLSPGLEFREGDMVEEVIEREPYPDVEHQSRRAYIFARKHAAGAEASDA
jgi:hypothetical protein